MNNRIRTAFLLAALLSGQLLFAGRFSGQCVGVSDGDTISVMWEDRAFKIRLEGIDCPEGGQDFSNRAKQFTSDLVFGKVVTVRVTDLDNYRRMIGRVYVDGKDVSLELVKVGLAWHFKRYSRDPVLAEEEERARVAGVGLWSMKDPVPPWEWRRGARPGQCFKARRTGHETRSGSCLPVLPHRRACGRRDCVRHQNRHQVPPCRVPASLANRDPDVAVRRGYPVQSVLGMQAARTESVALSRTSRGLYCRLSPE
ncbi:MAG: nuclease [Acidobacteria bacterium]|nr:MAG: nuclease [Acidobacteriota bacterium]